MKIFTRRLEFVKKKRKKKKKLEKITIKNIISQTKNSNDGFYSRSNKGKKRELNIEKQVNGNTSLKQRERGI